MGAPSIHTMFSPREACFARLNYDNLEPSERKLVL
jgi:hypothetical protein